jgi:hypothetical protein
MLKSTLGAEDVHVVEAEHLLKEAQEAIADHTPELGWRLLLEAQRRCLQGLRAAGSSTFRARAGTLQAEALTKLRSWRRTRVEALSHDTTPAESADPVSEAEFAAASEITAILFEHFANDTIKRRAQNSQTIVLVGLAMAEFATWWRVVGPRSLDGPTKNCGDPICWSAPDFVMAVMLFGLMGAAFSALISLASASKEQTIPEQAFTYRITLARQVVGLLSALAVYLLLASSFVKIGGLATNPPLVLLAAFASGFSERLVVRALERLSSPSDSDKGSTGVK